MVIKLRGRLDPAPDKRFRGMAIVEENLVANPFEVTVDEIQVRVVLANGNSAASNVSSPNALAGIITAESSVEDTTDIDRAASAMMTAATRLSDAIRSHQPSVGLIGQPPAFVSFEVKMGEGPWGGYNFWPPSRPIYVHDPVATTAVLSMMDGGIDLTSRLLGQAEYWAYHSEGYDPETAVLLAAIATESHAKRKFQEVLSSRGDEELGRVLFEKVPPSTYAVVELYHSVAQAIVGTSYKVAHRRSYNSLEELFQRRNQVAHTGRLPLDHDEARTLARNLIAAARGATNWLTRAAGSEPPQATNPETGRRSAG